MGIEWMDSQTRMNRYRSGSDMVYADVAANPFSIYPQSEGYQCSPSWLCAVQKVIVAHNRLSLKAIC